MLRKLDLPNGTSNLQLLTIIFLEWMNCHYQQNHSKMFKTMNMSQIMNMLLVIQNRNVFNFGIGWNNFDMDKRFKTQQLFYLILNRLKHIQCFLLFVKVSRLTMFGYPNQIKPYHVFQNIPIQREDINLEIITCNYCQQIDHDFKFCPFVD